MTNTYIRELSSYKKILLLTLILSIFLILQFLIREYIFFRDHAIFWDGLLRIQSGQVLYKDFGVPVGPVSFYLNYFLTNIFGNSVHGFHYAQIFQSSIILLISMNILNILQEKFLLVFWGGLLCTFLYLSLLWFPWYNTTAAIFYLAAIYFYLSKIRLGFFFAGVLVALSFFSKHDIGLLVLLCIIGIFLIEKIILNIHSISFLKFIYQFIFGFFLIAFLIAIFFNIDDLTYWMNFGGGNKEDRLQNLLIVFKRPGIYLSILLFFVALKKKNRSLLIYAAIATSSSISTVMSGLSYTHFYYVFMIPAVLSHLRNSQLSKKLWAPILFFGVIAILFPAGRAYFVAENIVLDKYDHYQFNHRKNHIDDIKMIDLGTCVSNFKGVYVPDDICKLTDELNSKFQEKNNGKLLNFSELTFIPHLLGMKNIYGQPLWYHSGVTFYEKERELLIKALKNGVFDLIIYQPTRIPEGFPIELITKNNKYEPSNKKYITPTKIGKKNQDCNYCYVTYYSRKN